MTAAILSAQAAATLENSRLLTDLRAAKVTLTEQVEELTMLQHVDQELNATLNLDNVMALTIDWALRRTRRHDRDHDNRWQWLNPTCHTGLSCSPDALQRRKPYASLAGHCRACSA